MKSCPFFYKKSFLPFSFHISGGKEKHLERNQIPFTTRRRALRIVAHESLHCLVACQAERMIKLCRGMVAVFGTLPEETLVIAEEGCALHLPDIGPAAPARHA